MYDFLHTEGPIPIEGSQNYLHQAADPPADTYDPEQDGIFVSESLGVHEHWNTDTMVFSSDRYTGIDFVSIGEEHATPSIIIDKPKDGSLYVFDEYTSIRFMYKDYYTFPSTIIVGDITVNASIKGEYEGQVDSVTFLIDDQIKYTDDTLSLIHI